MKNYYNILDIPDFSDEKAVGCAFAGFFDRQHSTQKQSLPTEEYRIVKEAYFLLTDAPSKISYDVALELYLKKNAPVAKEDTTIQEIEEVGSGRPLFLSLIILLILCVKLLFWASNTQAQNHFFYYSIQSDEPVKVSFLEQPSTIFLGRVDSVGR